MEDKLVIVNFKNYPEATLENSSKLLKKLSSVKVPEGYCTGYCVSPIDLGRNLDMKGILAQHVDEDLPGSSTGKVTIEGLIEAGISGSLLNHSENRIPRGKIEKVLERAKEKEFRVILCVESEEEAGLYAPLHPTYIAYEPPELIGGDISVSSARPEIIGKVVDVCNRYKVPVLVGAGVKNRDDLLKSLELGARGVLIASGIVRSSDPAGSLNSLMSS